MSRSYKKTPWAGDHKGTAKKRVAWKTVRAWLKAHPEEIPQGGDYKKLYETWDICDYGGTCTWEEYWDWEVKAWQQYEEPYGKPFPDKKEAYRKWRKSYKNK